MRTLTPSPPSPCPGSPCPGVGCLPAVFPLPLSIHPCMHRTNREKYSYARSPHWTSTPLPGFLVVPTMYSYMLVGLNEKAFSNTSSADGSSSVCCSNSLKNPTISSLLANFFPALPSSISRHSGATYTSALVHTDATKSSRVVQRARRAILTSDLSIPSMTGSPFSFSFFSASSYSL